MSVSSIESAYNSCLKEFSQLAAKLKFDFGSDYLLIDGTVDPATISHSNESADCTVKIKPETLEKLMQGHLDAYKAYRTCALRLSGITEVAIKFHSIALKAGSHVKP